MGLNIDMSLNAADDLEKRLLAHKLSNTTWQVDSPIDVPDEVVDYVYSRPWANRKHYSATDINSSQFIKERDYILKEIEPVLGRTAFARAMRNRYTQNAVVETPSEKKNIKSTKKKGRSKLRIQLNSKAAGMSAPAGSNMASGSYKVGLGIPGS